MITLSINKLFEKKAGKLDKKIKLALAERLEFFTHNPFHPLLNNHALHGKRKSERSINITGDYRLIYEVVGTNMVRLLDIDTHTNLYDRVKKTNDEYLLLLNHTMKEWSSPENDGLFVFR